jgi:hypothetical protein
MRPVTAQIDKGRRLRAHRTVLDQRRGPEMADPRARRESASEINVEAAADDVRHCAGDAVQVDWHPTKARVGERGRAIECNPRRGFPEQRDFRAIATAGVAGFGGARITDEDQFRAERQPVADNACGQPAGFDTGGPAQSPARGRRGRRLRDRP